MRKLLLSLLLVIFLLYGCETKTITNSNDVSSADISPADIDSITISALPSPPKMKTIDNKEDIEKIINHINTINKENFKQKDNITGWVFSIQTKGSHEHSISFVGDTINIDDSWYKVDPDEANKFRDLYNSLNYKEESVIS